MNYPKAVDKIYIERGRTGWIVTEEADHDARGYVRYPHGVSTLAEAVDLARQLLSFHPAETTKDDRK